MTDRQCLSLNMLRLVLRLLRTTNRTSGVAKLPPRVTQLGSLVEELNGLGEAQTRPTQGATEGRDAVFDAMKDIALDLSRAVAVHATDAQLPELFRRVEVNVSDFDGMRLMHRPWMATRIVDAAESVLAQLAPEVTAEMITEAREKIRAAETALDDPRSAIASKASATRRLDTVFKDAGKTIAQIDRLVFPLRKTDPEFYADYVAARRILDRPAGNEEAAPATATPATAPAVPATPTQELAA